MEGLSALVLVVVAMPLGLLADVAASRRVQPGVANSSGLGVILATATVGMALGWHARQRIRRPGSVLYGMTSSTLAMYGGLGILVACGLVMLRVVFPMQ